MQTKFNVGDTVYVRYTDRIEISKAKIMKISIQDDIYYDMDFRYVVDEKKCSATFEEAKTELIKDITNKYQNDIQKAFELEYK